MSDIMVKNKQKILYFNILQTKVTKEIKTMSIVTNQKISSYDVSFCDGCGTLLPPIPPTGDVHCLACNKTIPIEKFDGYETSYTIVFNKVRTFIFNSLKLFGSYII